MNKILLVLILAAISSSTQASKKEDLNGEINFHGAIARTTCAIDTSNLKELKEIQTTNRPVIYYDSSCTAHSKISHQSKRSDINGRENVVITTISFY